MDNFDHELATFSGMYGAHDTKFFCYFKTNKMMFPMIINKKGGGQISNLQKPIYDDANIQRDFVVPMHYNVLTVERSNLLKK
jgi:hypothetical protein